MESNSRESVSTHRRERQVESNSEGAEETLSTRRRQRQESEGARERMLTHRRQRQVEYASAGETVSDLAEHQETEEKGPTYGV